MSERLKEIRARLDAATPGPWAKHRRSVHWSGNDDYAPLVVAMAEHPNDTALIAHAPADLAWCLAEIDALRERVAVLRAEIADLEGLRA